MMEPFLPHLSSSAPPPQRPPSGTSIHQARPLSDSDTMFETVTSFKPQTSPFIHHPRIASAGIARFPLSAPTSHMNSHQMGTPTQALHFDDVSLRFTMSDSNNNTNMDRSIALSRLRGAEALSESMRDPMHLARDLPSTSDVERSWYRLARQQDALMFHMVERGEFERANLDWHIAQEREAFERISLLEEEVAQLSQTNADLREEINHFSDHVPRTEVDELLAQNKAEADAVVESLQIQLSELQKKFVDRSSRLDEAEKKIRSQGPRLEELSVELCALRTREAEAKRAHQTEVQDFANRIVFLEMALQDATADLAQARSTAEAEVATKDTAIRELRDLCEKQAQEVKIHTSALSQLQVQIMTLSSEAASAHKHRQDAETESAVQKTRARTENEALQLRTSSLEQQLAVLQGRLQAEISGRRSDAQIAEDALACKALLLEEANALLAQHQEEWRAAQKEQGDEVAQLQNSLRIALEDGKNKGQRLLELAGQSEAVSIAMMRLAQLEQECKQMGNRQAEIHAKHQLELRRCEEQLRLRNDEAQAAKAQLASSTEAHNTEVARLKDQINSLHSALHEREQDLEGQNQDVNEEDSRLKAWVDMQTELQSLRELHQQFAGAAAETQAAAEDAVCERLRLADELSGMRTTLQRQRDAAAAKQRELEDIIASLEWELAQARETLALQYQELTCRQNSGEHDEIKVEESDGKKGEENAQGGGYRGISETTTTISSSISRCPPSPLFSFTRRPVFLVDVN